MHHHVNHCWCSKSVWDGKTYDATNMVSIEVDADAVDFEALIYEKAVILEEEKQKFREFYAHHYPDLEITEDDLDRISTCHIFTLTPTVVQWLNENVKPQKSGEPGWATGNDTYRANDRSSLTLWFTRRSDAKKFIRTWSSYKKATSYFNYFDTPLTNVVLNLKTMKYENRHNEGEEELEIVNG